jgi:hypothetical protein
MPHEENGNFRPEVLNRLKGFTRICIPENT